MCVGKKKKKSVRVKSEVVSPLSCVGRAAKTRDCCLLTTQVTILSPTYFEPIHFILGQWEKILYCLNCLGPDVLFLEADSLYLEWPLLHPYFLQQIIHVVKR